MLRLLFGAIYGCYHRASKTSYLNPLAVWQIHVFMLLIRRFDMYTVGRETRPFILSLGLWYRIVCKVVSNVLAEHTAEDGGSVFGRNVCVSLPGCTV